MTKIDPGSGSISQRHGSADPDPPQNVMDPQHWFKQSLVPSHPPSPRIVCVYAFVCDFQQFNGDIFVTIHDSAKPQIVSRVYG